MLRGKMACVNVGKCEVDGWGGEVRNDVHSGTVLSLKSGDGKNGNMSKRPMCEVLVAGRKLVLMADSGSPWTIVVQDYLERMFEGIWDTTVLNEPDIVAESFEGTTIDVMGFVETEIVFKERKANIKLCVATKGVNVLGWKDQGYMTVEFGSIKEEEWMDCVKNDHVLQEVKKYVRDGWPSRGVVAAELEPFAKVIFVMLLWNVGHWKIGRISEGREHSALGDRSKRKAYIDIWNKL
ncbi:hypothetical protein NDU88_005712 [Pleurodeles waltl]|uniref:Uncharacterized protein n=1 Tax=Pleurodeles waltl TaxID=8319 RepID=A0AAV7UJR1_PLEWA|nr:hypothetical protein NDU88_005712 [Pleurodeles waltl]